MTRVRRQEIRTYCYNTVRRWTNAAKECYERGCACTGCFYKEYFEGRCQMKRCVFELVRVMGKPKGVKEPTIREEEI
jgi:hypothetical protein